MSSAFSKALDKESCLTTRFRNFLQLRTFNKPRTRCTISNKCFIVNGRMDYGSIVARKSKSNRTLMRTLSLPSCQSRYSTGPSIYSRKGLIFEIWNTHHAQGFTSFQTHTQNKIVQFLMPWYPPAASGCLDWQLSGSSFANRAWRDGLSAKIPSGPHELILQACCAEGLSPLTQCFKRENPFSYIMKSFWMNNLSVMSALGFRKLTTHSWPVWASDLYCKAKKSRNASIGSWDHIIWESLLQTSANWEACADWLGQLLSPVEQ